MYFLFNRGVPVSIYNLPLCLIPAHLSHFARQSISDWKKTCSSIPASNALPSNIALASSNPTPTAGRAAA